MGGGVFGVAEAAGDFLFGLGHADVALGAVVGERHVGVAGEAEHFGFVFEEGFVEVFGVGFGDAAALPIESDGGRGEFPSGLREEGSVALANRLVGGFAERLVVAAADLAMGVEQEFAQAFRPGVAAGLFDEGGVAQRMGAAQGMLAVPVAEVAGPAVVDEDAAVAEDDREYEKYNRISVRYSTRA